MGADRKHTFKVICLDRETGKIVWERVAYEGAVADSRHQKASFASSTPATDGKYVFAFFGTEGLYAYDYNGKLVWKQNLGTLGTASVGYGVSPILYKDLVIMQCDDSGGKSFMAAFDKKTGKQAWRTERKVDVTWSSPVLVRVGNRTELIASAAEAIIAYDPATGKELWRHKGLESNAVPTPVVLNDLVVVTSGSPKKVALALKAGGSGDVTGTSQLVWSYNKGTAYVPSPILYGDYLYLMTGNGSISCLQASDREGGIRGCARAETDDVHGVTGSLRGQDSLNQRRGRHFRPEGGSEARGSAHELARRTCLRFAGHRRWQDFYSRRTEYLLYR